MAMRYLIPFILAAVCSARVFRSMRELAHHHEKQQILARAYHQEKGLFVQFTRDKLAKDKKENKETIKNIVQSGQFCTQVNVNFPAASIHIGFNILASEVIADTEDDQGRVTGQLSLMFGGSIGVGFHASLWGQGDISISGIVPKKATWSGDDYNPANKGDMVFKPDAEAKDGVGNKGMTTQIFWLLKQWFRRKLHDIYDKLGLGSVSTKKKLMDLSAAIHKDLDNHSDDKDDKRSTVKAENAAKGITTVPAQQKLFKTLQYLHYKFFDMIQQFTIKHYKDLIKGNQKSLEIWHKQVINAAYRKVYMGMCDYGSVLEHENPGKLNKKHKAAGATVCDVTDPRVSKMKCRKVDPSWHTYFGQHPVDERTTKAAMQLVCTFMKRGVLLDKPQGTNKGFTNLKNMLLLDRVYPQLSKLTTANLAKTVEVIVDKEHKLLRKFAVKTLNSANKPTKYIDLFGDIDVKNSPMLSQAIVLSYPPEKLEKELLDKIEKAQQQAAKGKTDQNCNMKASATIGMGLTVGSDIVGYCTPDSNPLQVVLAKKKAWGQKENSNKCELGDGIWKPLSSTFSLVLGSGTFYLDYHRTGLKATESHFGLQILLNPGKFALISPVGLCGAAGKIRKFFRELFTFTKLVGKESPLIAAIGTTMTFTAIAPLLMAFFTTVNGMLSTLLAELAQMSGMAAFAKELGKALAKMLKFDLMKKIGIKVEPVVMGYISMNVEIDASNPNDDVVSFGHEQYFGLALAGIPAVGFTVDVQGYLTFAVGVECKLAHDDAHEKAAPSVPGSKRINKGLKGKQARRASQ